MLRSIAILLSLTVMAAAAFCQAPDRHLTSSDSQALFRKSTYAHGYMHGYEDGFHDADIDIHMGRGERPVTQMGDFKSCSGYQKEFGDKRFYRDGYQQGFREGYTDGTNGRDFRAITGARKAAAGLSLTDDGFAERDFDEAFSSGYESGLTSDPGKLRSQGESEFAVNLCQSKAPRSKASSRDYCDAFSRGFSLGFFDATTSGAGSGMQTARTENQQPSLK